MASLLLNYTFRKMCEAREAGEDWPSDRFYISAFEKQRGNTHTFFYDSLIVGRGIDPRADGSASEREDKCSPLLKENLEELIYEVGLRGGKLSRLNRLPGDAQPLMYEATRLRTAFFMLLGTAPVHGLTVFLQRNLRFVPCSSPPPPLLSSPAD